MKTSLIPEKYEKRLYMIIAYMLLIRLTVQTCFVTTTPSTGS